MEPPPVHGGSGSRNLIVQPAIHGRFHAHQLGWIRPFNANRWLSPVPLAPTAHSAQTSPHEAPEPEAPAQEARGSRKQNPALETDVSNNGAMQLKLGFHTGYWSAGPPPGAAESVASADGLGLDSVWTAEAYGSDAFTPLAWWGSHSHNVRLGTGIAQMAARTPTATAMAALTLDHLSNGRFILGLGASGPQVVEGWYGQPYGKPLARTREYFAIIRDVLRRETPVTAPGPAYSLPRAGELGKPLLSTVHPLRADLPIHLAAQGPKNTELAAEIADGWLPAFFSPRHDADYRTLLEAGFARRSAELSSAESFEVSASVPVAIGSDIEDAAQHLKPHVALYVGGMGSASENFHRNAIARLGWEEATEKIASLYRTDRKAAIEAVPTELVLDIALAGNPTQLKEQFEPWKNTCLTTLIIQTDPRALPAIAQALNG